MNMMKLAWQKFPCVLESIFPPIRLCSDLSLATKGIGTLCCTVSTLVTCYFSPATFHLTTPSLVTATFSACNYYLAENSLSEPSSPRWVRHSYLSKRIWLIPYNCGSSRLFSGAVAGEWSAFGKWKLVRKYIYTVLKFIVNCHYGNCSFEEFVRGIFTTNGSTRSCSSTWGTYWKYLLWNSLGYAWETAG